MPSLSEDLVVTGAEQLPEELREPWQELRFHEGRLGWRYKPDPDSPPKEIVLELAVNKDESERIYSAFVRMGIPFQSYGDPGSPRVRASLYWDRERYVVAEGEDDVDLLLGQFKPSED